MRPRVRLVCSAGHAAAMIASNSSRSVCSSSQSTHELGLFGDVLVGLRGVQRSHLTSPALTDDLLR